MNLGRDYRPAFALIGLLLLGACSTFDGVFDTAEPAPTRTPNEVARAIDVPEAPMDFALFEAYMDLAEARYYAGEEKDFEFFADRDRGGERRGREPDRHRSQRDDPAAGRAGQARA